MSTPSFTVGGHVFRDAAEGQDPPHSAGIAGNLQKRGNGGFKKWKSRFVEFTSRTSAVRYFDSDGGTARSPGFDETCIRSNGIVVGVDDVADGVGGPQNCFDLKVTHSSRLRAGTAVFELCATTAREKANWMEAIRSSIAAQAGGSAATAISPPAQAAPPTNPPGSVSEGGELAAAKREIAGLRTQLEAGPSPGAAASPPSPGPAAPPSAPHPSPAPAPTSASGLEQRLDQISVRKLLLESCKVTTAMLARMSMGDLSALVGGSLVPVLAAAVTEAVRPAVSGGGEEGAAKAAATSRGKYRQTLTDVIGAADPSKDWRDDFKPAMDAGMEAAGLEYKDYPHRETLEKLNELCEREGWLSNNMTAGYTREEAEVLQVMQVGPLTTQLGLALSEGSRRYAALTHAAYSALARKAREGAVAPKCYTFITNAQHQDGLGDKDPRWRDIDKPDETGFRGITSFVPMVLRAQHPDAYSPDGLKDNIGGTTYTIDSDVVCFESAPPEQGGKVLHSTVQTTGHGYMLPPFTLLKVVKVEAAGEWEYLPGQRINQRCITVRPTFAPPAAQGGAGVEANKFATNRNFLSYGNSGDVQRGLAEITSEAPMTMEQEWARNDSWADWKGERYGGWAEYAYVTGVAVTDLPPGADGARDKGREGWTVERFRECINAALRENASWCEPRGRTKGPPGLLREEVVAIRLYTVRALRCACACACACVCYASDVI
jgi:hypothetical protein